MTDDKLILTPFTKALASLESILTREEDEVVRDATIQRFEYTYELAWKMLKRHLQWSGTDTGSWDFKEVMREAARVKLIDDAEVWFEYRRARNQTSHTYEKKTAQEVYEVAKKFAADARKLLTELEKHHG